MRMNKTILLAFIYTLLFATTVCIVFYDNHINYITHAYLIGLLCMFPFIYLAVWYQKKDAYAGIISGKSAGREGLKFVVAATLFLCLFQVAFFQTSFKAYKINYIETVGPKILKEQISTGKLKLAEADIPKTIAADVQGVTLFKEVTSVIFKTIFYGAFCSFIVALILKRKN